MSCFKAAGLSGTFWRSHGIMCHGGYSSTSVVMCMALSVAGRSRPRHNGYTVPLVDRTCMALIEAERLTPREDCCTSRNSCIASRRRRRGELLSVSSLLLRYSCAWPRPCRSMWSRRSASSIACHSREHRGDQSFPPTHLPWLAGRCSWSAVPTADWVLLGYGECNKDDFGSLYLRRSANAHFGTESM